MFNVFKKKNNTSSDFSQFVREASSREKKKVFMQVIDRATEDQRKILPKKYLTKAA
jgi:hypothetical protein